MKQQEKKRRQVSFNIDDNLYIEYKKLMLEERTTPTADLTRYIQKRVNKGASSTDDEECKDSSWDDAMSLMYPNLDPSNLSEMEQIGEDLLDRDD
ncbi:hypothetical protein [Caproiciproducens sp. LBM24188]